MARTAHNRDLAATLNAARTWIDNCLVGDRSIFLAEPLWTSANVEAAFVAFVGNPISGGQRFMNKLKEQTRVAPDSAQKLLAEALWALSLFPSNIGAHTKRAQVLEIWSLSKSTLDPSHPYLSDAMLAGIGSGGPGFNNYKPEELGYLLALAKELKGHSSEEREKIFSNYDDFIVWISKFDTYGNRQFRHMLRYFTFPDRVERISSNNDRRRILMALNGLGRTEALRLSDRELDDALLELRNKLSKERPGQTFDFYESSVKRTWSTEGTVNTTTGTATVVVPTPDVDDADDAEVATGEAANEFLSDEPVSVGARKSIQIQAKLAEIGATMGFTIWIPRSDKARVADLVPQAYRNRLVDHLPLNYDDVTLGTIEQIDVIWLNNRAIARAFEVEHTTAVYSGLLRMADLLALQPNMDIKLHIVAPSERREKVFREMLRPVFTLLARGPLSRSCTFMTYESVVEIGSLENLPHIMPTIISEYEEAADDQQS